MKSLISAIILSFSLTSVNPALAATPVNEVYEVCVVMAQSMINIYGVRESGVSEKEATAYYDNVVGQKQKSPFHLRIYKKIKEIYNMKDKSEKAMVDLVNKEYDLCNSLQGEYSKLLEIKT